MNLEQHKIVASCNTAAPRDPRLESRMRCPAALPGLSLFLLLWQPVLLLKLRPVCPETSKSKLLFKTGNEWVVATCEESATFIQKNNGSAGDVWTQMDKWCHISMLLIDFLWDRYARIRSISPTSWAASRRMIEPRASQFSIYRTKHTSNQ